MTDVISFSGVHGSGKTTIINNVANRLTNIGKRVFVLQEFPYIPDIPIGTVDFQAWYDGAMNIRSKVVRKLIKDKEPLFDVILLDRHPLDVAVYTSRLIDDDIFLTDIEAEVKFMHYIYNEGMFYRKSYTAMFLLERPYEDLIPSLRLRQIAETHRTDWNEEDDAYLTHIIDTFRLFKENDNVIFIENKDLDDTKDLVFEHITQRLKK